MTGTITGRIGRHVPGVLLRHDPEGSPAPVVFDIPRSGADYPRAFRSPAPFDEVHRSISMYVEELYGGAPAAGAVWLFACFPNAWIDANRGERDIDPALLDGPWPEPLEPTVKSELGIGLIHRVCGSGGVPLHAGKLAVEDVRRRLDDYYRPYHRELGETLAALRDRHGRAFHVSCHSMSSVGGQAAVDRGTPRSEFDIGDGNGRTTDRGFVDCVVDALRGFGYQATVNRHYAGAESIHKHADPEGGIHSLQIEINRGLYMDEDGFVRGPRFAEVRGALDRLAAVVCDYAREHATTT